MRVHRNNTIQHATPVFRERNVRKGCAALIQALYNLIHENMQDVVTIMPVYTVVPEAATYPYILLEMSSAKQLHEASGLNYKMLQFEIALYAYIQTKSTIELYEITQLVIDEMQDVTLELDSEYAEVFPLRYQHSQVEAQYDNLTWQVQISFECHMKVS